MIRWLLVAAALLVPIAVHAQFTRFQPVINTPVISVSVQKCQTILVDGTGIMNVNSSNIFVAGC